MKASRRLWTKWCFSILIACIFIVSPAFAGLLPFPLSANQRGIVDCLENPAFTYDIYLPPAYSTTGTPLPIIYTMHPNGGGMVGYFQNVCASLNIIVVGLIRSQNGGTWDESIQEDYAVTRDIRQRVLYDPTAEFAGGFSGGGECSYMFSRIRAQHVAGVFAMGGWMGRGNLGASVSYYGTDRVLTNLLVARATGTTDNGTIFYNPFDSNYLASCGAVVQDWYYSGGHTINVPDSVMSAALSWLLNNRIPAGPYDQASALVLATNWQSRITAGQQESVFRECVSNLMTHPRSWLAYQAQLTLDQLMTNYTAVRSLNVSNLAQGDFASDLFFYYAAGAATNGDWSRYDSCMKALTGITVTNDFNGTTTITGITETVVFPTTNGAIYITTTNGDRAGDIYTLLLEHGYPNPVLHCYPGQMNSWNSEDTLDLWLCEDTPGLAYSVQSRSNLVNDIWQGVPVTAVDTNTIWSTSVNLLPGADSGFYRISATPSPATSPPWPD